MKTACRQLLHSTTADQSRPTAPWRHRLYHCMQDPNFASSPSGLRDVRVLGLIEDGDRILESAPDALQLAVRARGRSGG